MAVAQELKVVVTLDDRRATQGLSRLDKSVGKASGGVQGLSGSLKGLGKAAIAAFVVKGLIDISKASLAAASSLEESNNAIRVVFENSVDIIDDFGKASVKNAGLARASFNKLAVTTGALLKNAGLPLDQVAGKTVELTQRAADLASVFDTDVADASQALGAALRNETEPARRFGITLNEAAIESEALSSGLVKTKAEITEAVKIQARYNIILKQSADAAGDFANTQESFANQSKMAKENLQDLAAAMGRVLTPAASAFLTKALNPLLTNLTQWINDTVTITEKNRLLAKSISDITEVKEVNTIIEGLRLEIEKLNKKEAEYLEIQDDINDQARTRLEMGHDVNEVTRDQGAALRIWSGPLNDVRAQQDDLNKKIFGYQQRLKELQGEQASTVAQTEEHKEAQVGLNREITTYEERLAAINARLDEYHLQQYRAVEDIKEFNLQMQLQEALISSYGSIVTSTFNDVGKALVESENKISGVFGAIAKGAIGGVAVVLDALAQQSAALAAFNIGKGLAAGPLGGPFYAAAGQFTLAAAAAATAAGVVRSLPVPELADGGIIPATPGGRLVKVAEAGQAEAVIPLNKMGMGGQTVNYISYNTTQVAGNVLTTQRLAQEVTSYQQQQRRGF